MILSTIHQAKGLEWKVVFLIWCAEGRFPNPKAIEEGARSKRSGASSTWRPPGPMDQLYLCYPLMVFDRQVGPVILRPSRFIAELKAAHYEEWQVGEV